MTGRAGLLTAALLFVPLCRSQDDDDLLAWCYGQSCEENAELSLLQRRSGYTEEPEPMNEPLHTGAWGFDLDGMDRSVHPGDNFYRFISGSWLKKTAIPSDQISWGNIPMRRQESEVEVHQILKDNLKKRTEIGLVYKSFMDVNQVQALGTKPLQPALDRIRQIKTAAEFAEQNAETHFGLGRSLIGLGVDADAKDPKMHTAYLTQRGGLGLPDRDYYLKAHFADKKEQYGKYIARMLQMIEWPDAAAVAPKVLAFEESIARVSWPREELRDSTKTYNKMKVADLHTKCPGFDWGAFMRGVGGISNATDIIVDAFNASSGDGVVGIARLIGQTVELGDLGLLKAWAAFHVVDQAAPYLPDEFVEANFDFKGKILRGQNEIRKRWKRAVAVANKFLPDLVGKEYAARYFPASTKETLEGLADSLKVAFEKRLRKVSWMKDETKQKALQKLHSFRFEVGYPKKWHMYNVSIDELHLIASVEDVFKARWDFQFRKLGKPVDPDYWSYPPQTVNAFFDPQKNRCVFLAAILQPPFFNPKADISVNYGSIGSIIGHEMTHGFDDEGRKYDAQGKLNNWWTHEDVEEFKHRAAKLGRQYGDFTQELPAGAHINPALTMGENIADLGGVNIALDAYHAWRATNTYRPEPPLLGPADDGLEGERRFFAGFAQVWRQKSKPEATQIRLVSDPHSPAIARTNLVTRNIDGWYRAFNVTEDGRTFLAKADRIEIW